MLAYRGSVPALGLRTQLVSEMDWSRCCLSWEGWWERASPEATAQISVSWERSGQSMADFSSVAYNLWDFFFTSCDWATLEEDRSPPGIFPHSHHAFSPGGATPGATNGHTQHSCFLYFISLRPSTEHPVLEVAVPSGLHVTCVPVEGSMQSMCPW